MFTKVQGNHPGRSVFDLSYDKKFTCDMGMLIPLVCEELVPGDKFTLSHQFVIRMAPLVAPIMHEISYRAYGFFVPSRLLMGASNDKTRGVDASVDYSPRYPENETEWEIFLTGGRQNNIDVVLPTWDSVDGASPVRNIGSLWDYFGFPVGINPAGALPLAFGKRAYNLVWFHFFRDENLQIPNSTTGFSIDNENILPVAWQKDYFTSALPFQQRGVSPGFNVDFQFDDAVIDNFLAANVLPLPFTVPSNTLSVVLTADNPATSPLVEDTLYAGDYGATTSSTAAATNLRDFLRNYADSINSAFSGSTNSGFNINDLRLAVQIQRWMELSARSGFRLIEFLRAHFGVSPSDSRLQRPEYIGGLRSPLIISEVLQTSSTDSTSPQGEMAGHGITADSGFLGSYFAQEHGYIIVVFTIMPKPVYQQGINRQWLRRHRYDFYFPEFAHLSEQLIYNAELLATEDSAHNLGGFGFQGVYDEMRYKPSMVCGNFRDTLDFWHLSRIFDPASPPVLNDEFIQSGSYDPATGDWLSSVRKDIFAFFASTPDAHGFYINAGNYIRAVRPLPYFGTPGRLDHVGGM